MERRDPRLSAGYLDALADFLAKTAEISDQLLVHMEDTDYKSMDVFKAYIGPQKNIERLICFYNLYTDAAKTFSTVKIAIEKSDCQALADRGELGIPALDDIAIIDKTEALHSAQASLADYRRVKIVQALVSDIDAYVDAMAKTIRKAFLSALDRLPKVPDGASRYAQFLLGTGDSREFLALYTKKAYSKLGFFEAANNLDALLQQTGNITSYLGLIIEINTKILGKPASHNISLGLITLIVVNLKKIISDALGAVGKDTSPARIPFLVGLCGNLRHSEGPAIREIEDLFVFRDPICKLVLNCFIQFFGDLELLEHPRSDCTVEGLNAEMVGALQSFASNRAVRKRWVEAHGPSFGVYKPGDLGENFGGKCLIKTAELSRQLSGMERYIYLINNQQAFVGHVRTHEGRALETQIDKNCQILVGLWRIAIEGVEERKLNRFLRSELQKHARYRLPAEQRKVVADALKEMIEGLVASSDFVGNISDLIDGLGRVYAGGE